MGFKEWRQRQLDRADAMTAWADRTDQRLAEEKEARAQEQAAREVQAERDRLAARAAQLGEDHDDLVRRAKAVGMDEYVEPAPGLVERTNRVANGMRRLSPLASFTISDGLSESGTQEADPYAAWRNRIVIEEAAAAKLARGEQLSRLDRATLKLARITSK